MESTIVKAEPATHNVKTCCLAECEDCAKSSIPDAPDWVASTVDELRDIANWMENSLGNSHYRENAGFIRMAAHQLEILAGAYEISKKREFPREKESPKRLLNSTLALNSLGRTNIKFVGK